MSTRVKEKGKQQRAGKCPRQLQRTGEHFRTQQWGEGWIGGKGLGAGAGGEQAGVKDTTRQDAI